MRTRTRCEFCRGEGTTDRLIGGRQCCPVCSGKGFFPRISPEVQEFRERQVRIARDNDLAKRCVLFLMAAMGAVVWWFLFS